MQVLVFLLTVIGASYFLIFQPDSQFSLVLIGLMPLGWLGLFALRYFAERKKSKEERLKNGDLKTKKRKKFHDPTEYL
jgi:hypothetical protein